MSRIFETLGYNDQGDTSIFVYKESEIKTEYNCYGMYFEDEDFEENLADYRERRNIDFDPEECKTLDQVKEFITEFQDCYLVECGKGSSYYGRPKKVVQCEDEEYYTSTDGFFYDEELEEPFEEGDACDEAKMEFIEYHDGSNFKKTYLTEHYYEEVTNELGDSFDRKTEIADTRTNSGTGHNEFYYDAEKKIIWEKIVSYYQGVQSYWSIIENEDEIDIIFVRFANDKIAELRKEMIERYGENLEVIETNGHYRSSYEIFSKDDAQEIGSYINDPYNRNSGGTFYKLTKDDEERYIVYTWSAYQGDWNGYSDTDLTLEEIEEKTA